VPPRWQCRNAPASQPPSRPQWGAGAQFFLFFFWARRQGFIFLSMLGTHDIPRLRLSSAQPSRCSLRLIGWCVAGRGRPLPPLVVEAVLPVQYLSLFFKISGGNSLGVFASFTNGGDSLPEILNRRLLNATEGSRSALAAGLRDPSQLCKTFRLSLVGFSCVFAPFSARERPFVFPPSGGTFSSVCKWFRFFLFCHPPFGDWGVVIDISPDLAGKSKFLPLRPFRRRCNTSAKRHAEMIPPLEDFRFPPAARLLSRSELKCFFSVSRRSSSVELCVQTP